MPNQRGIRPADGSRKEGNPQEAEPCDEALCIDGQRTIVYRYLALRCLNLTPYEVLRLLLMEGEDPGQILEAIGQMADRTWDRLELLVGLWLNRPALAELGGRSLQLGIHPVSLPLFLPGMATYLPAVSSGTRKGVLACRMNDLVLSLANDLGVRAELKSFQQAGSPGFEQTEVDLKGPGSSRILMPGLKFRHSITIQGDPTLAEIPVGMEVGHSLRVIDCPSLRSIPDDFRAGRNLCLRMVPGLEKVPDVLEVGGHLDISGPGSLGVLPRRISCGGDLFLETDLAAPGSLEELRVKGSALISVENLISLPSGTRIGGRLQLFDCPRLESLPEGLEVHGDLMIRKCPSLSTLGSGTSVGGVVNIEIPCPLWDYLEPGEHPTLSTLISHIDRRRI